MKHIYYLLAIALPIMLVGCSEDELTDKEILDSRTSTAIEVDYAYKGTAVSGLSFSHQPSKQELTVNVNNENLKWNLESNSDWCTVVQEEHKGSGVVTLEIASNESFEARTPATLTFVAGNYRGFKINVEQRATAFVISDPYFVSSSNGGSYSITISTPIGQEWSFSGSSWLNATKKGTVDNGEYSVTTLELSVAENAESSRYGSLTLSAGEDTDDIYVYQFGSELTYDTSGNIFFSSEAAATISFTAPEYLVSSVNVPDYAEASVVNNGDGTSTVTITFDENLSDCAETRSVSASLQLNNASASVVSLPGMVQDYVPAYGLVTAKGLQRFAAAWAAGEDVSDWQKDGVVNMVGDIDMNEVSGWTGIGTAEKPFNGKFNGAGYTVNNLKGCAVGLFNQCQNASIQNVTLGKGCSIYYNNDDYNGNAYCGGIATKAEGTSFTNCVMSGSFEFAGISGDDTPSYVGGIVGHIDASSSVKNCKMNGKLSISSASDPDVTSNVGGIVGAAEGTVSSCEMSGELTFNSGIGSVRLGGVVGDLSATATVSSNSFVGTINSGGTAADYAIGGIYGYLTGDRSFDNTSDQSVSMGAINISSFANAYTTRVCVGGFVGAAADGITLSFKGYETQTAFWLDQSVERSAECVYMGGILGAPDPSGKAASLEFDTITNSGTITLKSLTTVTTKIRYGYFGGVVGYANGPSSFKNCTNKGVLGAYDAAGEFRGNRTNGHLRILGGIAGMACNGNASFTSCSNEAAVTNYFYNNNIPGVVYGDYYSSVAAGGILGAFEYKTAESSFSLSVSGCSNSAEIASFRGYAGGIVGFAQNATISNCTSTGAMNLTNNNASHKGGIIGGLSNSTVSGCTAKCTIYAYAQGGATACPGGIASIAMGGNVKISGCSYFGAIDGAGTPVVGGILSTAEESSEVSGCKFGGSVKGLTVSENNVASQAVGNGQGGVSNISYWDGN